MMKNGRLFTGMFTLGFVCVLAGSLLLIPVFAQEHGDAEQIELEEIIATVGSPLHPAFPLLDSHGDNVLDSGNPVSTMSTCGTCHDTAFIAEHSVHTDVGASLAGELNDPRAWVDGIGTYGGWNAITYDLPQNMSVQDWLDTFGARFVGGGIAEAVGVEMDCFLCHTANPNNIARTATFASNQYQWATTASLIDTGLVSQLANGWEYSPQAFDAEGNVLPEYVSITEPRDENCSQCHGLADGSTQIALSFDPTDTHNWQTLTTGQVFSPQRLSNSALNLDDREELARSWDVHAERAVNCVDCHYSLNNPVFYREGEDSRPDHLEFDPRRMEFGDYLSRPLHQFANGGTSYVDAFPVFENAERDCATCHDAVSTHEWLAYPASHMNALACETCHVPELYAPALETVDWTMLDTDGEALMTFRGLDESTNPALLTGYQPVLLPDTEGKLAPYNTVTAWYWISGDEPVPMDALQSVILDRNGYVEDILTLFDADVDGFLNESELFLDSQEKVDLIASLLLDAGYPDAYIAGEVQAYAVHHNVTHGEWATRECSTCHSDDSLVGQEFVLGNSPYGTDTPLFVSDALTGSDFETNDSLLMLLPASHLPEDSRYVFGRDAVSWVDWFGVLLFLATLVGVMLHGGLRYMAARRMPAPEDAKLREVYMYSIYERQWHWLQTAVIFGLLFTGLIIHKPDMLGFLSFRWIVLVHNAFALILIINAALAAFYHLVSGEIRQFLPEPRGFFGKMFAQVRYYAWGIFNGEPHPMEKTPGQKMNPIQQLTYLGLLNVLLPAQVITGALMWGMQHYPQLTAYAGGLAFLAPLHSLISWTLASFIVLHVYMTTTGHEPLTNIRAMIFGWDEVEVHET
jgi:thiosulfate reductase cytochrome b subunit